MSNGSLLFPIGYQFTDADGVPLNAGKVYFDRTGTSTDQDTYSDSTLSSANANPLILNSAGRSATLIYGDPTTGFDYRVTVKTSADVTVFGPFDDVKVDGGSSATFASGSFTGTLTGYASGPTGTVTYAVFANAAGTGKLCTLRIATAITGTSNTTALTMTGLPAACTPTAAVYVPTITTDNGTEVASSATIAASGTTITFATDQPFSATGYTNSGTKALAAGWSITYPL